MDFGCGTGSATPFFFEQLRCESVVGVDVSAASVAVARATHGARPGVRFAVLGEYQPDGRCDLVFCNGVFHHIEPAARPGALQWIRRCLRPDGLLALWENNPWNPGAQIVMARIPFDRDAIKISPPAARRLVAANGFEVLEVSFQFIFPRLLKWLRALEAPLAGWPLGAQYQVLARRV
jgi:SAM-dependent methyltransferase